MAGGARVLAALAILACAGPRAHAQDPSRVSDLAQIVGLFEGGCMRFAGYPAGLRGWAASRGLQPVPAPLAASFLGGLGPGRVFAASTISGKHALVSYESGACQIIAPSANPVALRTALRARLAQQGIAVTPAAGGLQGAPGGMQLSFRAWSGRRQWLIGILSRPSGGRGLAPELHLFAMLDRAVAPAPPRARP